MEQQAELQEDMVVDTHTENKHSTLLLLLLLELFITVHQKEFSTRIFQVVKLFSYAVSIIK